MKCSIEGSTGVVLSDFKKEERPGVTTVTAPWAMSADILVSVPRDVDSFVRVERPRRTPTVGFFL